jgi:hypothetical protein
MKHTDTLHLLKLTDLQLFEVRNLKFVVIIAISRALGVNISELFKLLVKHSGLMKNTRNK